MGLEDIYKKQIEANSIEKHEEELNNKLGIIQLVYADDQFRLQLEKEDNLEIQEEKGIKFSDILEKDTSIINLLSREYEKRKTKDSPEKEFFIENVKKGLDLIYSKKSDNWKEETLGFIEMKCDEIGEKRPEKTEKKNEAGILHYVLLKNIQSI